MRLTTRKFIAIFLAMATAGLLVVLATTGKAPAKEPVGAMAALSQTCIALNAGAPLQLPALITTNKRTFLTKHLQGHWSVIFFGFTSCPMTCPQTLSVLSAVAHNSASGILSGTTQPVFVSVDPEHDSPEALAVYLKHFDSHIIGLTGSRDAVDRFAHEIGAGYRSVGSTIDHSTSLFVVDPKGRLAGILLRPNKPATIVADLTKLRFSYTEMPVGTTDGARPN